MPLARRVMSLWLRRWPIDRLQRRAGPHPFVLVTSIGSQRLVSAADAAAAAEGIAPGMTLADARALRPDLVVAAADFAGDAAALARLAQWCGRYSPWTAPCGPDGIWLDVTGCAHLHGGEARLAAEIVTRLEARGVEAVAAIAGSPGAAWAVARFGEARTALVPEDARALLELLPVAALRLPPEVAETLVRLGLRRIGDLYPMPRPALVLRFGALLATRLDQALGRMAEPLSPLPPPPLRWARRRFADPIVTLEAIDAATQTLLEALCRRLAVEGVGARRLELTLYRVDGAATTATVGTARPSREPRHLLRLLEERFGTIDPGLGIEDMVLAAAVAEPQPALQLALPHHADQAASWPGLARPSTSQHSSDTGVDRRVKPGDDAAILAGGSLASLVDRLTARLGEGAVSRPRLHESHWPERAVECVPPFDPGKNARPARQRPVRLLPRPEPVETVAPVPDDPPVLFRWRRVMHRVRRADGPERIVGEWWRNSKELRDYYRIEDESGRRFWLYRSGLYRPDEAARWFLHGVFA